MLSQSELKPSFQVTARLENARTGDFSVKIRFTDNAGSHRDITASPSLLKSRRRLQSILEDKGAYFSGDPDVDGAAWQELDASLPTAPQYIIPAQPGWFGDGTEAFASTNWAIDQRDEPVELCAAQPDPNSPSARMRNEGSLKAWQNEVARPALQSSRMVCAISATFAGPLLKPAGMHPFGLMMYGPSKAGKSTLLVSAGSVIGFRDELSLPNFRATATALAELPASFNDMALLLNEFGAVRGGNADLREILRVMSYGLAEGRGTQYSSLACGRAAPESWRCIAIGNSEHSSDAIAAKSGETRDEGEMVRWIDLPALSKNSPDIFDYVKQVPMGGNRADWLMRTCKRIRKACEENHGVAFHEYIHKLTYHRRIAKVVADLQAEFVEIVSKDSDSALVLHLANAFAIIYVGGVLGVHTGVLPWTEEDVLKSLKRCFRAAKGQITTEDDLIKRGLKTLAKNVASENIVSLKNGVPLPSNPEQADGYRTKDGKRPLVTISVQALYRWFPDHRVLFALVNHLAKIGALPGRPEPKIGARGIKWAEQQPKWSGGKRHRCLQIDLSKLSA